MPFASHFQFIIFAAVIALCGCAGPLWEPPGPGSVVAESFSPDGHLLARIITTEDKGTYTLEIRDVRTGDVLSERTISAPVGYHKHLVSLVWGEGSRTVTATIDHDFGEDKRVIELRSDHIAVFNEKNK